MNQEIIGKNIRRARRGRDMTQDDLAERLSVTESAVSQWESGKTVPDLLLIPPLCAILGVTSDWLLGVDEEKRWEEIAAIEERAHALSRVGHREEAAAVLREGLKTYPESESLLRDLMYDTDDRDECIRIGERLLEISRDESIRQSAIQNLVYAYTDRGDTKRAEEIAMMLPSYTMNRKRLLLYLYAKKGGEDYRSTAARYREELLDDLYYALYEGVDVETAAARGIRLYELMYEDGDYGFHHTRLQEARIILAFDAARSGDGEKTLHALKEAADHALAFLDYLADPDYRHTSVFFRDERKGTFSATSSQNSASEVLEAMRNPVFDFVRDTPAFAAIRERLEPAAGEWKVGERNDA
ncbi:MAG: helix-turn-helix domain-containing protein [Clostridiales bacterium]|nr:helix-turn-helix domain-containing protein [Clostridiales bacterium]